MELTYPPLTASIVELLRDYPHAVEVGLFINQVQTSDPVELADLVEPTFPGYQRWNGYHLEVIFHQLDPVELVVAASPRFELTADIAPLTVRGWFLLARLESGARRLVAFEALEAPVSINRSGDVVLATLWLTVQRVDGNTVEDILGLDAQVLALANGGRRVKFRGNERKTLRNLKNAIQAVQRRDARWLVKSDNSRMADIQVLTDGTPDHAAAATTLLARCTALLALD